MSAPAVSVAAAHPAPAMVVESGAAPELAVAAASSLNAEAHTNASHLRTGLQVTREVVARIPTPDGVFSLALYSNNKVINWRELWAASSARVPVRLWPPSYSSSARIRTHV